MSNSDHWDQLFSGGGQSVNCCALAFLLHNPEIAKIYLHFKIASRGSDNATAKGRREVKLREGSILGAEGHKASSSCWLKFISDES